jgi:hypoxanthine-guanine phosphoribosyltransferase
MRGGYFNGFLSLLPISGFILLLVHVDKPHRSAPASLLDRHPAVSARIRTIGIDRTSETANYECLWFVGVLHGCCPFALAMMARA